MPNQRRSGVRRITVTISEEILEAVEEAAAERSLEDPGFDRLDFIREAIEEKLEADDEPPPSAEVSEDSEMASEVASSRSNAA